MKEKEEKNKKKLERLLDTIKSKGGLDNDGKPKIRLDMLLSDSDSSASSGDEATSKHKKKMKAQRPCNIPKRK